MAADPTAHRATTEIAAAVRGATTIADRVVAKIAARAAREALTHAGGWFGPAGHGHGAP